jgi:hypothetical protein
MGILLGTVLSALLWVVALDQQGKILDSDASTLVAGADEAVACVQGLIEAQAARAAA